MLYRLFSFFFFFFTSSPAYGVVNKAWMALLLHFSDPRKQVISGL